MDYRKLIFIKGFTLLELLIALILIGLISTIVLTNSSFLQKYDSSQIESYKTFIQYLSEESALTKKTVAWFIGNNTQSIAYYQNGEWRTQNLALSFFPSINPVTEFKDGQGSMFFVDDKREDPFLVFSPSGQSSGGSIQFADSKKIFSLEVNRLSSILIKGKES